MTTAAIIGGLLVALIVTLFFGFRSMRAAGQSEASAEHRTGIEVAAKKATQAQLDQARESQTIERDVAETSEDDLRKELKQWSKH